MEHRDTKTGLRNRRRTTRPSSRRMRLGFRLAAITAAVGVAITGGIAAPASAIDYPSWGDLQAAKSNTAAAQEKVTQIQNAIAQLQDQVAALQAAAIARGEELQVAQDKFDEATRKADEIQAQADASKAQADAATKQAGQLAAQLYRTGGTDLTANLMMEQDTSGTKADALLSKLGSMSKLVQRSTDIYDTARAAANAAGALGKQAEVAQTEREKLRVAAEAALAAAVAAQQEAETALAASQVKSVELAAQLQFMQDTQAKVAADYQAGVAERARIAAEAAAAAAAAAAASGGGGGGPGPGLGGGYIGDQGWAVPASGRITDGYGPRPVICGGGMCSGNFHYGADIGAGCGAPIYAAQSGTVTYAGRSGTYGNYVRIDGGGAGSGYAHIRDGGIFVRVGQQVDVGQNIASVGMTGAATGCHLHFEVYAGGGRINPFPFMAARGVPLG